jgi:hypothetical protein
MKFWFVTAVSKYPNRATSSKYLLSICMSWF